MTVLGESAAIMELVASSKGNKVTRSTCILLIYSSGPR
jgi:hypothetical protein